MCSSDLVVIVFGASRLPELGKGLGLGMRGFRDALKGKDESDKDAKKLEDGDE